MHMANIKYPIHPGKDIPDTLYLTCKLDKSYCQASLSAA